MKRFLFCLTMCLPSQNEGGSGRVGFARLAVLDQVDTDEVAVSSVRSVARIVVIIANIKQKTKQQV